MSNKNPFELRTEVLSMAKEYMDKQYNLQLEYTQKMIEQGQKTLEDLPKLYSPEQVTELAKQFYDFVQKKD